MATPTFGKTEIEDMRVQCYRHWVAHFGTPSCISAAAWDGCFDEFPKYGWQNAEDELVIEFFVRHVKKVQVSRC